MKGETSDNQSSDSQDAVVEHVKARLQEEGREARNLVAYSLPLQDPPHAEAAVVRHREVKRLPEIMTPRRGSKRDKRPRSASAGRDPQASMRARLWGFLFRNLQQAVDEIYQTCEDDESVVECKEAIFMLERYSNDFQKLIEWLKLKREYEHTPPPQRPKSLTWEIRTSSPGKISQQDRKMLTLSDVRRALTFDKKSDRLGIMNGSLSSHEKRHMDKVNNHIQEGKGNEFRKLSGATTPTKPVIIVHEPRIEEQQEEGPQATLNGEASDKTKDILLEKLEECDGEVGNEVNMALDTSCEVKENAESSKENDCSQVSGKPSSDSVEESDIKLKNDGAKEATEEGSEKHKELATVEEETVNTEVIQDSPKKDSSASQEEESGDAKENKEINVKSQDPSKTNKDAKSGNKSTDSAALTKSKEINLNSKTSEVVQRGPDVKASEGKPAEVEVRRSCAEVLQGRSSVPKPGPTVNMNKASQVRQAYNQNKTPQRQIRSTSASSRQSTPRPSDLKSSVSKQQGAGGKLTFRRTSDGKPSFSPPSMRRQGGDSARMNSSGSKHPMPNSMTRSHSSLGITGRGGSRSGCNYNESCHARNCGSNSSKTTGLGNQAHTASTTSLSSSTSSGGLSWADKVRGAPLSLESSQLSLQADDGEGWEVVRRGRRSHGGSSASLNNSFNNHNSCSSSSSSSSSCSSSNKQHRYQNYFTKNSRSGSLKSDGHRGSGMKSRFNMPSTAMSLPSLTVAESGVSKSNQSKSSTNRILSADDIGVTGKEKESMSRTKDNKSNISSSKKSEGKKNRHNSGADDTNRKNSGKKERGKDSNSSKVQKENRNPNANAKKENSDLKSANTVKVDKIVKDLSNAKSESDSPGSEDCVVEYDQCEVYTRADAEEKPTHVNYICDPSIPETSENSDNDDDDRKFEDRELLDAVSDSKVAANEPDLLNAERESRSYDSDSFIDEEEMRYNAAALESAVQEEKRLEKQIAETEKVEIQEDISKSYQWTLMKLCGKLGQETRTNPLDSGDDPALGEVEAVDECEEDGSDVSEIAGRATSPLTPPYDSLLASLSWADQVDAMESLEDIRHPGRVLHIHEKLSSPSRKRSLSEKMRRHEEKLVKAQELREKLMQAKTEKLKDLFKRIEEVRQDKELLQDEKRDLFQRKMKRAEEKRRQYLQEIVNKAHDEENKAKEIAFINGLEAQNKLHDIMQQHQSHESRLADMAEERTRRQEEKAAKEVAAQERRKALEAERQARMAELCEKRRRRCERIDRKQAERREELLEQAREKARDREERLSALLQAQQAKETELVKKIQQKQEDSARRHEENIEQIRQRALESSIMKYSRGCDDAPRLHRYETKKLCTLCNSLITSEVYLLSHLRGRHHQKALRALHQADTVSLEDSETYNLKHIIDAPANIDDPQVTKDKERHKALKRRCRKIRTRMNARGKDYNSAVKPIVVKESPNKSRIMKALQQIVKLVASQGSGPWPSSDLGALDRPLLELVRIFEKKEKADQVMFSAQDGFTKLNSVLAVILDATEQKACVVPAKSLGYCGKALLGACRNSVNNCRHILYSNLIGTLIDYLMQRLNELVIETTRMGSDSSINTIVNLPSDAASWALFEVLAEVIDVLYEADLLPASSSQDQAVKDQFDATWLRLQDVISYCVSVGLADKVSWYFSHVQGPVDNDTGVVEVLLAAMRLISVLSKTLAVRSLSEDPTQLIGTLHVTDACGVVSLLYGLLLHQGGRLSQTQAPPKLPQTTQSLTVTATTLLHNLASLDLTMFQNVLGSEGISLELRHIASYLLWYCSHWPCETILHNVIPLVGFFAVNNKENQMVIQSGEVPSVLQQLCNLPWQYFSEPRLTAVLFPTLLACCLHNEDNMIILQQEMSFQVLEDFLNNCQASDKPLVHILQRAHSQG